MGTPGRASQQPPGGRLSGLSTPCGRGGTSISAAMDAPTLWAGRAAPCLLHLGRQEPQHPARALARVDHVRVLAADPALSAGGAAYPRPRMTHDRNGG